MVTLANLQGGSLVPDIGGQLGRGAQTFGNLQTQALQRQQIEAELARSGQLQSLLGQLGGAPQAAPAAGLPAIAGPVDPRAPARLGTPSQGIAPAPPGVDRTQALAQLAVQFPQEFDQVSANLGLITQQQKDEAADFAFKLRNTPFEDRAGLIKDRTRTLRAQGRNASDTASLEQLGEEQQNAALDTTQIAALSPEKRLDIARGGSLTAAQREFAGLTEGLTPEQKEEATLIKLGLSPRAVGSAIQTISARGIAELIGDAQAIIKERGKFGELTGASRSKAIDSGFARIGKISTNINNLDRAIAAVEAGAGVGAIERRFPSIRAASVELDQIQGELALDVIGSVTFGALSEGELNLAKQIALPTGLEGPQLIQHLRDRKSAQEKLRSYFQEQINFLDQGGSVAGFLRNKERQVQTGGAQDQTPATQQRNISVDF